MTWPQGYYKRTRYNEDFLLLAKCVVGLYTISSFILFLFLPSRYPEHAPLLLVLCGGLGNIFLASVLHRAFKGYIPYYHPHTLERFGLSPAMAFIAMGFAFCSPTFGQFKEHPLCLLVAIPLTLSFSIVLFYKNKSLQQNDNFEKAASIVFCYFLAYCFLLGLAG